MRALLLLLVSFLIASPLVAHPTNIGYSGAPGRGTCASTCHGVGGGTIQVFGFPAQYTPSETYLITVRKLSGVAIKNFNGSCRFGTGAQNAGTISAGLLTATYNVTGETNGVHMSTIDHDSAQFNWTAPAVGSGVVRLYVGGHQGPQGGQNTTIVMMATEAPTLPGPATNPSPGDGFTGIAPSAALQWTAGAGASSHDVYFGLANPPPLIAAYFEGVFFDPDPDMNAGTTYYWEIDARNDAGVTPGPIWSFTIMNAPGPASNPIPADSSGNVLPAPFLEWTPGPEAYSHDVYFGTTTEPPFLINVAQPVTQVTDLLPGTTYFWRVDEGNEVGVAPGTLWQFTTLNLPLPAMNPEPADGATDVPLFTNLSWSADSNTTQFDVYLDTQSPPLLLAGTVEVTSYNPPQNLEPGTTYYWKIASYNGAGQTPGPIWSFATEASAADDPRSTVPTEYALGPAYPNPFNAVVSISFALPISGPIELKIFDVTGRAVATLADGIQSAGWHTVSWSAENTGSGVYLVRMTYAGGMLTQKIVALK
jgi:hypothetical protein